MTHGPARRGRPAAAARAAHEPAEPATSRCSSPRPARRPSCSPPTPPRHRAPRPRPARDRRHRGPAPAARLHRRSGHRAHRARPSAGQGRRARRRRRRLRHEALRRGGAAGAGARGAAPRAAGVVGTRRWCSVDGLEIDLVRRRCGSTARSCTSPRPSSRCSSSSPRNPGKLLTHEYLLRQVWGQGYGTREQLPARLRGPAPRKLGDDAANPRLIVTEPGIGYRWIAGEPTEPRD